MPNTTCCDSVAPSRPLHENWGPNANRAMCEAGADTEFDNTYLQKKMHELMEKGESVSV